MKCSKCHKKGHNIRTCKSKKKVLKRPLKKRIGNKKKYSRKARHAEDEYWSKIPGTWQQIDKSDTCPECLKKIGKQKAVYAHNTYLELDYSDPQEVTSDAWYHAKCLPKGAKKIKPPSRKRVRRARRR